MQSAASMNAVERYTVSNGSMADNVQSVVSGLKGMIVARKRGTM